MNIDYALDIVGLLQKAEAQLLDIAKLTPDFSDARHFVAAARALIREGLNKIQEAEQKLQSKRPPLDGGIAKFVRPIAKV